MRQSRPMGTYRTCPPPWVIIGHGGSPLAHIWYWSTWSSQVAKSTGT